MHEMNVCINEFMLIYASMYVILNIYFKTKSNDYLLYDRPVLHQQPLHSIGQLPATDGIMLGFVKSPEKFKCLPGNSSFADINKSQADNNGITTQQLNRISS